MITGVCIVKNEEGRIVPTLESYAPYVDRFVVCDTGSTDWTIKEVNEYLDTRTVQEDEDSELCSIPFVDFSHARNQALRIADSGPGWLLMFDCDSRLEGDPEAFRKDLAGRTLVGALSLLCRLGPTDPSRFHRRCLVRAGVGLDGPGTAAGWHFRYPVHEVLLCGADGGSAPLLTGVEMYYEHVAGDPERRRKRWRNYDLPAIKKYLSSERDPRMQFYLGQTYECLGEYGSAITAYRTRVENPSGFSEERFEAQKRIGDCYRAAHGKTKEGALLTSALGEYLSAFALAPHRAEPLDAIARIFLSKGHAVAAWHFANASAALPYPPDSLFVDHDLYTKRANDMLAFVENILTGEKT